MTRRTRLLAIVSWLGGAASVLPFAEDWFELEGNRGDFALLAALASAFALGVVVHVTPALQRPLERLAGPAERPAQALLLVAVLAGAGALAMVALTSALGSA